MIIRFTVPLVLALTAQSLFAASGDDLAVIEQPTEVPTISPIATVNIEVEKKWELYLRGRASASEPPLLIGVGLPPGAVMTEAEEGWYLISWRPKNSDVGPHVLTVRAMDPQDPNKQFDRDISVDVHSDAGDLDKPTELAAAKPASTLVASSDLGDSETNIKTRPLTSKSSYIDITSSDRAESHEIRGLNKRKQSESNLNSGQEVKSNASELIAPTLKPITTHILSAGRVLAIRVAPELDYDLPPVIQIDRLPGNASFDANDDGSRTFYWPTNDSDQGHHQFRFTVIHPDDSSLKTTSDLTVIIGDPTKQITVPYNP